MLSNEEILALINDKESDRIERTTSIGDTDKFAEAICAFSNDLANHQKPGYLFIGVHDKTCKLSGLKATDKLLKNIAAIRSDGNILPQPAMTVHPYTFDDGDVIAVEVQPAHFPPVRYKGTIWIRVGPRRGVANEMEERLLTEKRTSNAKTFDERPCFGSTIDDLNINLFKMIYLPKAVSAETLENDSRDIKLQLASLRFYDLVYDCPTNAGVLMFGNNVRYFFPMAYVQFVKFDETTKASYIQADTQISGDLISMVNELNSFVRVNIIKRRPIPVSTLIEEDVYNYSESAIREFLMNALMHRSYEITSYIKFYQYQDRIEIENPGGLYGNARPENFPNVSDYRNLVISESMRVMGYVNRFNRGIEEAQLALRNNKNELAEFDLDTFGVFRVIIKEKPIEKIKASFSNPWDGTIKDVDNENDINSGSVNGYINEDNGYANGHVNEESGYVNNRLKVGDLSENEKVVFYIIKDNENINQKKVNELFPIPKRTLTRYLKTLKEKGFIEFVGSTKTGGYHIL
jgi:ATP-dependent DNA helicase RecG